MLIQPSLKIWLALQNQARELQADWLIMESNGKAFLHINMPVGQSQPVCNNIRIWLKPVFTNGAVDVIPL